MTDRFISVKWYLFNIKNRLLTRSVLAVHIAHLPTPTKPFSKGKKPLNLYRSIKVIAHDFCVIREVKVIP